MKESSTWMQITSSLTSKDNELCTFIMKWITTKKFFLHSLKYLIPFSFFGGRRWIIFKRFVKNRKIQLILWEQWQRITEFRFRNNLYLKKSLKSLSNKHVITVWMKVIMEIRRNFSEKKGVGRFEILLICCFFRYELFFFHERVRLLCVV